MTLESGCRAGGIAAIPETQLSVLVGREDFVACAVNGSDERIAGEECVDSFHTGNVSEANLVLASARENLVIIQPSQTFDVA
jgi:hypothetical protein